MKTGSILFAISGHPKNVNALSGRYTSDFETTQVVTYSIENGLATITAMRPLIKTELTLPLPFSFAVNDLGSGIINRIDLSADDLSVSPVTCPYENWTARRRMQAIPTIQQTLMADYIGLL